MTPIPVTVTVHITPREWDGVTTLDGMLPAILEEIGKLLGEPVTDTLRWRVVDLVRQWVSHGQRVGILRDSIPGQPSVFWDGGDAQLCWDHGFRMIGLDVLLQENGAVS